MDDSFISAIRNLKVPIPARPKLATWVSIVDLGESRVQFRGMEYCFTLNHELFCNAFYAIQKLLDGNHSPEEIISSGGEDFRTTTLEFLLKILCANGLIYESEDASGIREEDQAALQPLINFFSQFTPKPFNPIHKIGKTTIGLVGDRVAGEKLGRVLVDTGFRKPVLMNGIPDLDQVLKRDDPPLDFLVVIGLGNDSGFFTDINSICLERGLRWLSISLGGKSSFLGPTIVPYNSPCFQCLETRFHSQKENPHDYLHPANGNGPHSAKDLGNLEAHQYVLAGEAALELTRLIAGHTPPQTIGTCFEFGSESPVPQRHTLFKVPGCPACGVQSPKTAPWPE